MFEGGQTEGEVLAQIVVHQPQMIMMVIPTEMVDVVVVVLTQDISSQLHKDKGQENKREQYHAIIREEYFKYMGVVVTIPAK